MKQSPDQPNPYIVAFVVQLARSGNYTARQITTVTRSEFVGSASLPEINAAIKNAADRLLKQHER